MKIRGEIRSIKERFRCDFVILRRQVFTAPKDERKTSVDSAFYNAKADGDFRKIIYGSIRHERQQLIQLFAQSSKDRQVALALIPRELLTLTT